MSVHLDNLPDASCAASCSSWPQILFLFHFPERVWHWLQADRADRREPVQHVRLGRVEEQEEAHVCGSERQRQANEGQEDAEKKHGHTLPAHSHRIGPVHRKHSLHWGNTWNFFLQYQEMSLEGGTMYSNWAELFALCYIYKLLAPEIIWDTKNLWRYDGPERTKKDNGARPHPFPAFLNGLKRRFTECITCIVYLCV